MITTVGKEDGQPFERADLENFPCDDLKTLDGLWRHYSKTPYYPDGKWGFSIQKQIWQECGSPRDYNSKWKNFGVRIGWRTYRDCYSHDNLTYDLEQSLPGELPFVFVGGVLGSRVGSSFAVVDSVFAVTFIVLFSRVETCEL